MVEFLFENISIEEVKLQFGKTYCFSVFFVLFKWKTLKANALFASECLCACVCLQTKHRFAFYIENKFETNMKIEKYYRLSCEHKIVRLQHRALQLNFE